MMTSSLRSTTSGVSRTGTSGSIRTQIVNVVEDMIGNREGIPDTTTNRTYSPSFTVRILPGLHRKLALEAAELHVSLNRLPSSRLTRM
ncbi:toxin-antitoxin system HicB family antitoxin [Plantibacter sp. YIM 135347]|uniref:toxin-antitoxin system HicB family antitoxin n=1 Tax=Plantibacter sp. YIM 135347 TaxID=3423919 RepID=UPI003D3387E1